MGYRSDVAFAVSDKLKTEALIAQVPLPEWCVALEEWGTTEIKNKGYSIYELGSIKWYDDFDCVIQTRAFIEWAEQSSYQDQKEPRWGFIRIGEEREDIELEGDPEEFGVYVETNIAIYP